MNPNQQNNLDLNKNHSDLHSAGNYATPTANLNVTSKRDDEPSEAMLIYISSAAIWARIISWASIIGLVLLALAILLGIALLFTPNKPIGAMIIAGSAVMLWLNWVIYSTMRNYANIAKELRDSPSPGEDIAQCFEYISVYFKWVSIFTIVMFVFGLLAALFKVQL